MSEYRGQSVLEMDSNQVVVRATYVGQRVNHKQLGDIDVIAGNPLLIRSGQAGCLVVFRFGVVVYFNISADDEKNWHSRIRQATLNPFVAGEDESLELVISDAQEGFVSGRLTVNSLACDKIQMIAYVLAKSVVLAYYEKNTAELFDTIEPLANDLREKGHAYRHDRELLRHIGNVLSIESKMIGRAEVGEKPDLLWEHPELERLFVNMEHEYEIRERHLALNRKFELISRTATTLLDLLQYKRTLRVEWYIVILIVVDILVSLGEKLI